MIKLTKTYTDTGQAFDAISLREPRWSDYVALGPIAEWQRTPEGLDVLLHHHDTVAKYAERLVEAPRSVADLQILNLADTIKVHDAVRDFFSKAMGSTKPATTSSGDTEKA